MNYAGQYNAQTLGNWTSEWGGGSLPKPDHGTAVVSPGMSVRMTPGGSWDTYYQLQRMPAMNWAKQVVYHVSYKVADADLPACQALEGEFQRHDGATILNGGFQFDFRKTHTFNTYDFSVGHWVPTSIPADVSLLSGNKILDVVMVYDLTPQTVTFRGVQINSLWNALGITRQGVTSRLKPGERPYLNYATQWDFTASTAIATMYNPGIDITVT